MNRFLLSKWTKVGVFSLSLVPLVLVAIRAYHQNLTANPVEFLQHFTGDWTLRFLIFSLAITPLRKVLNLPELIRFRRMLGLFAFFYVCLHFITYIWFDQGFDLMGMWHDVQKRRFITVGFLGFVLLIPLAVTSTKGWIRRLGRETMADAPPSCLCCRELWRHPLLLAGEIRCTQTRFLRSAGRNLAAMAIRRMVPKTRRLGGSEYEPKYGKSCLI